MAVLPQGKMGILKARDENKTADFKYGSHDSAALKSLGFLGLHYGTENPHVGGSIPSFGTNDIKGLAASVGHLP
jgi:hypothetical protein